MLPYFEYTEDIENFCRLMGFIIDLPNSHVKYVCMYDLGGFPTPYITSFNLGLDTNPLIPPEKVLIYLTLMLNGYSFSEAINELNAVG